MYYFNARWYNPETGRFASEDPARDGINWYAYVGNNPLKYTDPTGLRRTREERRAAREQRKAERKQKREERKQSSTSVTWDKPSPSSSSESDSSDSDDNSSGGANKEPPEGINTLRDNSRANPPNHGSENSEKAFDASAVGDVKDGIANELPKALDTDGSPKETETKKSDKNIVRTDPWGIYAIRSGTVVGARTGENMSSFYGNTIIIKDSETGESARYAHLDSTDLKIGDQVSEGQQIGVMGKTGNGIPGPNKHLHVSVYGKDVKSPWWSSEAKSPIDYIASGTYPANTKISNPWGSKASGVPGSSHEGVDFSGLEKNLINDWGKGIPGRKIKE